MSHRPNYGTVLIVDDDEANARMLGRILYLDGYSVETAADGEAALAAIAKRPPDVLILDIMLPKVGGFDVCRRVKGDPATRLTPVVLLLGLDASKDRIEGIDAGAADFLSKPYNTEELRARVSSLMQLKHHTDQLESAESVILSLALAVEARDDYTNGHCQRLATYATAVGSELGLPDDALEALKRGAYLHDVGKVGIPDAILLKPSTLTRSEFEVIRHHTIIGEALCGDMRSLAAVRPIIRNHHERLDGSGYPDGLHGSAVPLVAQIVGVVDAYDAMTTTRPYRRGRSSPEACAELIDDAKNGKFSVPLVNCFIALIDGGQFESSSRPM